MFNHLNWNLSKSWSKFTNEQTKMYKLLQSEPKSVSILSKIWHSKQKHDFDDNTNAWTKTIGHHCPGSWWMEFVFSRRPTDMRNRKKISNKSSGIHGPIAKFFGPGPDRLAPHQSVLDQNFWSVDPSKSLLISWWFSVATFILPRNWIEIPSSVFYWMQITNSEHIELDTLVTVQSFMWQWSSNTLHSKCRDSFMRLTVLYALRRAKWILVVLNMVRNAKSGLAQRLAIFIFGLLAVGVNAS